MSDEYERAVSMGMGPSGDLVKRLWLHDMHPESASRQAADHIEALEAKLAKAVEVLEAALKYNTAMHGGAGAYNQRIKDAIAELKGQDDE